MPKPNGSAMLSYKWQSIAFELDWFLLMLEDTLLKLRFNRGDTDALRLIYEKYKDDLLKLAIALLNDSNLAEDVVNDAFVSFTKSTGTLHLTGRLKSFLATCVANHARNVYRARERKKTVGLNEARQLESPMKSPEQTVIFDEACRRLQNAMNELPYEQRETVILYCYRGLKFRQIAESQNTSINTVKSRYRYGLEKLSLLLNSEFEK
jgi:RNA polymerase sigma factor (sigma-70 family)